MFYHLLLATLTYSAFTTTVSHCICHFVTDRCSWQIVLCWLCFKKNQMIKCVCTCRTRWCLFFFYKLDADFTQRGMYCDAGQEAGRGFKLIHSTLIWLITVKIIHLPPSLICFVAWQQAPTQVPFWSDLFEKCPPAPAPPNHFTQMSAPSTFQSVSNFLLRSSPKHCLL